MDQRAGVLKSEWFGKSRHSPVRLKGGVADEILQLCKFAKPLIRGALDLPHFLLLRKRVEASWTFVLAVITLESRERRTNHVNSMYMSLFKPEVGKQKSGVCKTCFT